MSGINRLGDRTNMLGEAGQEERVEDATSPDHNHVPGLLLGKCGLIDPWMCQGVKSVCQTPPVPRV